MRVLWELLLGRFASEPTHRLNLQRPGCSVLRRGRESLEEPAGLELRRAVAIVVAVVSQCRVIFEDASPLRMIMLALASVLLPGAGGPRAKDPR